MKLRRHEWPTVIAKLVDAFVAIAKKHGVRGVASVHEIDRGNERHYAIVVRVPAGETVAAHGNAPRDPHAR